MTPEDEACLARYEAHAQRERIWQTLTPVPLAVLEAALSVMPPGPEADALRAALDWEAAWPEVDLRLKAGTVRLLGWVPCADEVLPR